MYLFHRIEERLDGSPTMILVDEGWKALDDAIFAARLRDWLKTLRKRNAIVGFATQSARDALDSGIAAALVEQTATMIFTPNARARAEDYCEGFGLSAHELELIRALPVASHCFLIRQGRTPPLCGWIWRVWRPSSPCCPGGRAACASSMRYVPSSG
jgi:type IV secretion system protein VirB4